MTKENPDFIQQAANTRFIIIDSTAENAVSVQIDVSVGESFIQSC